jgi:hypothetical protein
MWLPSAVAFMSADTACLRDILPLQYNGEIEETGNLNTHELTFLCGGDKQTGCHFKRHLCHPPQDAVSLRFSPGNSDHDEIAEDGEECSWPPIHWTTKASRLPRDHCIYRSTYIYIYIYIYIYVCMYVCVFVCISGI